jgi:tetratricopeptide (TPR) repeat protein
VALLDLILKHEPTAVYTISYKAWLLFLKEEYAASIELVDRAFGLVQKNIEQGRRVEMLNPDNVMPEEEKKLKSLADLLNLKAKAQRGLGEHKKAFATYKSIVGYTGKTKQTVLLCLQGLGETYYEMEEYDQAIECSGKLISANCHDINAYRCFANALKAQGKYRDAAAKMNQAVLYSIFKDDRAKCIKMYEELSELAEFS